MTSLHPHANFKNSPKICPNSKLSNFFLHVSVPPPPPPMVGALPVQRLQTQLSEAPACVQNAMMTKDKKPFTYTPGGIDLSQIKSPRMAKRKRISIFFSVEMKLIFCILNIFDRRRCKCQQSGRAGSSESFTTRSTQHEWKRKQFSNSFRSTAGVSCSKRQCSSSTASTTTSSTSNGRTCNGNALPSVATGRCSTEEQQTTFTASEQRQPEIADVAAFRATADRLSSRDQNSTESNELVETDAATATKRRLLGWRIRSTEATVGSPRRTETSRESTGDVISAGTVTPDCISTSSATSTTNEIRTTENTESTSHSAD